LQVVGQIPTIAILQTSQKINHLNAQCDVFLLLLYTSEKHSVRYC